MQNFSFFTEEKEKDTDEREKETNEKEKEKKQKLLRKVKAFSLPPFGARKSTISERLT